MENTTDPLISIIGDYNISFLIEEKIYYYGLQTNTNEKV
jgi:hypothetical protein